MVKLHSTRPLDNRLQYHGGNLARMALQYLRKRGHVIGLPLFAEANARTFSKEVRREDTGECPPSAPMRQIAGIE